MTSSNFFIGFLCRLSDIFGFEFEYINLNMLNVFLTFRDHRKIISDKRLLEEVCWPLAHGREQHALKLSADNASIPKN